MQDNSVNSYSTKPSITTLCIYAQLILTMVLMYGSFTGDFDTAEGTMVFFALSVLLHTFSFFRFRYFRFIVIIPHIYRLYTFLLSAYIFSYHHIWTTSIHPTLYTIHGILNATIIMFVLLNKTLPLPERLFTRMHIASLAVMLGITSLWFHFGMLIGPRWLYYLFCVAFVAVFLLIPYLPSLRAPGLLFFLALQAILGAPFVRPLLGWTQLRPDAITPLALTLSGISMLCTAYALRKQTSPNTSPLPT